jgi:hypothetical protein
LHSLQCDFSRDFIPQRETLKLSAG